MQYRWNFGDGQVGETRETRRAAREDGAVGDGPHPGWTEIYVQGTADEPGDWFRCGVRADG